MLFNLFLVLVTVAIAVQVSTRVDLFKKHPNLISAICVIAAILVAFTMWPSLQEAVAEKLQNFLTWLAGLL